MVSLAAALRCGLVLDMPPIAPHGSFNDQLPFDIYPYKNPIPKNPINGPICFKQKAESKNLHLHQYLFAFRTHIRYNE